jgi:hypothetical protein
MANTIRVFKSGREWVAKRDGATRGKYFRTQKEAYLHARSIALNNSLTITVYYPNGGIKAVINPRNSEEEGGCFLTTACVDYFGLKDNCSELETLRYFRDSYLLKSVKGKESVSIYYKTAPILVKMMQQDKDHHKLFVDVFRQIKLACNSIKKGNNKKAYLIYKSAFAFLYNRYKK